MCPAVANFIDCMLGKGPVPYFHFMVFAKHHTSVLQVHVFDAVQILSFKGNNPYKLVQHAQ